MTTQHARRTARHLVALVLAAALAIAGVVVQGATGEAGRAQAATAFAQGADISWVPGMEAQGYTWKDKNGVTRDIIQILKNDYQIDSVRIRVFVNPSSNYGNGYINAATAAALAKRAQNAGMRVMLTLHYSDSWADPGQQTKPAAWSSLNFQQLMDQVWNYTRSVMTTMQAQGVTPEWVQVGNETNNGMLWNDGRASTSMQNYAYLVTTGHNAVKSISPSTKTIVHLANANDNALYVWNIGGLVANGAQFDVIGMSLYPEASNWSSLANSALYNMQDMVNRYGKEIMISEVGMDYNQPAASKAFIADMVAKTKSLGDKGLGVFYWEPQAFPGYNSGYNKGAWNANGTPTVALEGFVSASGSTAIDTNAWYTITNRNSGKVLDVFAKSIQDGAAIVQWAGNGGWNQQWKFTSVAGGYYTITNRLSGKLMDITGASTASGAANIQWTANGGWNQQWQVNASGGYVTIVNRNSGMLMDITGKSTADGAANIQWPANGGTNQQWSLTKVG